MKVGDAVKSSISPLYSETTKPKHFFDETKTIKKNNVEFLNTCSPGLQLQGTGSSIGNKLKD